MARRWRSCGSRDRLSARRKACGVCVKVSALDGVLKLPAGQQDEAARLALKQAAESSFYLFAKYILGYRDLNMRTHEQAVQVLESDAHRKFVIMPRGTFKSTLVSVAYPIWLLAKDPNLFNV